EAPAARDAQPTGKSAIQQTRRSALRQGGRPLRREGVWPAPAHLARMPLMRRRGFIASTTVAALTLPAVGFSAAKEKPIFAQRGYYLCFMRMPTFGLKVWKEILDGAAQDGANTVILWVAGAFRSKKFPITWQWAKEHENVRADFVGALIKHAHQRSIQVLLGFTPFGYDGVNQYPLEHPELK